MGGFWFGSHFECGTQPEVGCLNGEELFSTILVRIANAVEPLDFKFVHHFPSLPLLDGIRERLRNEPGLFDQLDNGQIYELHFMYRWALLGRSRRRKFIRRLGRLIHCPVEIRTGVVFFGPASHIPSSVHAGRRHH